MTNSQADTGLSLTDAAARLGISERTVLRRIKDGTIDGRKVGEGRGGVWRVYLNVSDSLPAPVADSQTEALGTLGDSQTIDLGSVSDSVSDSQTQLAPETLELVRLVDKLQTQNQQLAGQLGYLQRQVQEQQETIQRLLMSPKDDEQPAQSKPKSWWRKLWSS